MNASEPAVGERGTPFEVFRAFLLLGLTSFGGPVAHLGYFREAFVARRRWLDDAAYADLVALCQFLPGPASSQVGMAIGLRRAGYPGMLAAWTAFTLPSAILLVAFAAGAPLLEVAGDGWLLGLKAAAAAVVADALFAMARNLAPDRERATIAAAALAIVLVVPIAAAQIAAIVAGAVAGLLWLRLPATAGASAATQLAPAVTRRAATVALAIFAVLLVAAPFVAAASGSGAAALFDRFYRTGALVFGGGHVVLPLLQAELVGPGLVGRDAFLAGYGAAQAVPGPLFTFTAFLGFVMNGPPAGLAGAAIALAAVFLPSALLVVGALPFWSRLRDVASARCALAGVNAAVVGLLAAAFYDPVLREGVASHGAMALAAACFVALTLWRIPPWAVVIAAGLAGQMAL